MLDGSRRMDMVAYVFAVADDDACNTVSTHRVKGCTHIVLVLHPKIVVVPPYFRDRIPLTIALLFNCLPLAGFCSFCD